MTEKTPVQNLLDKLSWWCDLHATPENLAQLNKLVEASIATDEYIHPGDSYCLRTILGSTETPDDVVTSVFNLLLAKGADIHYKDGYGNLLHVTSATNRKAFFEQVLQAGVAPNQKNNLGNTPLHHAVRCNQIWAVAQIAKLLQARNNFDYH